MCVCLKKKVRHKRERDEIESLSKRYQVKLDTRCHFIRNENKEVLRGVLNVCN